jgi:hypothetical protein
MGDRLAPDPAADRGVVVCRGDLDERGHGERDERGTDGRRDQLWRATRHTLPEQVRNRFAEPKFLAIK